MRLHHFRTRDQRAQTIGDHHLAWMRTQRVDAPVEDVVGRKEGLDRERTDRIGGGKQSLRAQERERGVMWASGARSPLAPTEPWHGTTGVTPRLRISTSKSSV